MSIFDKLLGKKATNQSSSLVSLLSLSKENGKWKLMRQQRTTFPEETQSRLFEAR